MRTVRSVAASLAVLAIVSGCAPAVAPPPGVTESRLSPLLVAGLVVDGTGITAVRSSGVALDRIPFAEGPDAVTAWITRVAGPPIRRFPQARGCIGTREQIGWDAIGLTLDVPFRADLETDAPPFLVSAIAPSDPARLTVAAPGVGPLGSPVGDWVDGFDSAQVFDPFGQDTLVAYDVTRDEQDVFGREGLVGAIAHVDEAGTLTSLRSPTSFAAFYC